jgi:hypothetical protein
VNVVTDNAVVIDDSRSVQDHVSTNLSSRIYDRTSEQNGGVADLGCRCNDTRRVTNDRKCKTCRHNPAEQICALPPDIDRADAKNCGCNPSRPERW